MKDKNEYSNVDAIVQARFGSTRLPGKILKPLSGKPMLLHVFNRLAQAKLVDKIIIATTILPEDDAVQIFCEENKILFFRGSSADVLSRYYETAKRFNSNVIIRITADCPLIDPTIIDKMVERFTEETVKEKFEYLSNVSPRTFPRGLDTEIFSFASLEKTYHEAHQEYEREHVTPYIYQHPEIFSLSNYPNNHDYSFHRWTVDTAEDFELIKEIYDALYNEKKIFLFADVLKLFENRPELFNINQNVKQKGLSE